MHDPSALNYVPWANVTTTCTYTSPCPEDVNGDGATTVADMLVLGAWRCMQLIERNRDFSCLTKPRT